MPGRSVAAVSRRRFISSAVGAAGILPLSSASAAVKSLADVDSAPPATTSHGGYRALSAREAAVVEALVTALCPADALTDDGVSSGLAAFIDAYVAGDIETAAFGRSELFRSGLAAVDVASRTRLGSSFDRLRPGDARELLAEIRAGRCDDDFRLSDWQIELLEPILTQACFAGPIYGAYGSRMFVKLFG